MTAVQLRRLDPEHNMARFYVLDVQPTLFGEWEFVREFGRIGSPGRVMVGRFSTMDEAASALARTWRKKLRRGYCQHASMPHCQQKGIEAIGQHGRLAFRQ